MQGTMLYAVHERMQPKKPWVGGWGGFETCEYNCTVDFRSLGLDFGLYNVDNW
jgi:hypothetical protein